MASSKRTIQKIASSASDIIAKATNLDPAEEKGNTIEKKSLLNTNTNDEDPVQFEWEIESQLYKKDENNIKVSQNWVLALIVTFVLFCGLLLSYLFIFDYFSVENSDKDYIDTDDQKFKIVGVGVVTSQDIAHLKYDVRKLFDDENGKALIGGALRLVFNDCSGPKSINGTVDNMVSICDGCIDDKNPINTGLYQHVIQPLDQVFIDGAYDKIMSRADYWIAAATIAIQYAVELRFQGEMKILQDFADQIRDGKSFDGNPPFALSGDTVPVPKLNGNGNARLPSSDDLKLVDDGRAFLPALPLMFGRMDCISSPFATMLNEDNRKEAPSPNDGWKKTYKWFQKNFGFDINDTVAIMGAHTLGIVTLCFVCGKNKYVDDI